MPAKIGTRITQPPPPELFLLAATVRRVGGRAGAVATAAPVRSYERGSAGGGGMSRGGGGGTIRPARQARALPHRRQKRDVSGISFAQRGQRRMSMPHLGTSVPIIRLPG